MPDPNNLISLKDHKPWLSGPAKCSKCGREWVAVAPIPAPSGLECPNCGSCFGFFVYPIVEKDGVERFSCNYCAGQVFNILKTGVRCVNCGFLHVEYWNARSE